ncbi:DUF5606 family protein [Epilithonimonas arachidiradicis]|uniref:Uncharacterized protein n=1 Tax=Epilithonimonas arachidiradicis TaxID=1617282 RepID=A0A420CPN9_9FLAO|nr:DUF5606 domain-containing protein [Epilithonimonas arachidiradicis]RKE80384.1 hypothetical protein BXY58_2906 [Epilithonimonas arachidiradicis]GGG64082.1 hypothetical protein GCM10007332_27980 [Epilithonimonas arachidiradicis]
MQLEKIISISGKPGLFKLVSQLKNGFIVEDISTKKKASISNSSQVSLLDNIAMFTFDKEVPLFEVFENIAKKYDYKPTINHKSSSEELRAFMAESLPNYDVERVYESDIKKLAQWYNLLQKAGYITPESFLKPEVPAVEVAEEPKAEEKAEKAEKKPAAKKAPAKKAAEKTEEAKEEKAPAKKPAAKKATKKED